MVKKICFKYEQSQVIDVHLIDGDVLMAELHDVCFVKEEDRKLIYELIRAVYNSAKEQDGNIALLLGYVKKSGEMVLFEGDQRKQKVQLENDDKLILFSTH